MNYFLYQGFIYAQVDFLKKIKSPRYYTLKLSKLIKLKWGVPLYPKSY